LVTGLAVVPPLAADPALQACLLEVTGQVAAPQPGLPARNQRKKSFVKRCRRVAGAIANGL
jgi:hypothetical protein